MLKQKQKQKFALHARCTRIAFVALLSVAAAIADASNLDFLNDTPMSYLKKQDIEAIKSSLIVVLNTAKDGETSRWINEGTGNSVKISGMFTPESTRQEGIRTCRRVWVVLVAKGQSMDFHPSFCGTGQTDWTLQKR